MAKKKNRELEEQIQAASVVEAPEEEDRTEASVALSSLKQEQVALATHDPVLLGPAMHSLISAYDSLVVRDRALANSVGVAAYELLVGVLSLPGGALDPDSED